MPTAVERGFNFLKLDGIDGAHEQAALNNAFLKIDSDFLKLSSANADSFLKIEHSPALKADFRVIGDAFLKLGHDFSEISHIGLKIDEFVVKLTGGAPTGAATATVDGPQADFLKLDTLLKNSGGDLKILGADFLKLDQSSSLGDFQLKVRGVSDDFLKLSADTAADSVAFLKLSADFLKLGNVDNPSPLDLAYKELGGDLRTIGAEFAALSTDFLKLDQALLLPAVLKIDGPPGLPNGDAPSLGAAFMALNNDFLKIDGSFAGLGGAASALIGLLRHERAFGDGSV